MTLTVMTLSLYARLANCDDALYPSALVEEIYRAQKERDVAVMNRLRLANEERDEALMRLKRSEKGHEASGSVGI